MGKKRFETEVLSYGETKIYRCETSKISDILFEMMQINTTFQNLVWLFEELENFDASIYDDCFDNDGIMWSKMDNKVNKQATKKAKILLNKHDNIQIFVFDNNDGDEMEVALEHSGVFNNVFNIKV